MLTEVQMHHGRVTGRVWIQSVQIALACRKVRDLYLRVILYNLVTLLWDYLPECLFDLPLLLVPQHIQIESDR